MFFLLSSLVLCSAPGKDRTEDIYFPGIFGKLMIMNCSQVHVERIELGEKKQNCKDA
jgi:hypothetical protein